MHAKTRPSHLCTSVVPASTPSARTANLWPDLLSEREELVVYDDCHTYFTHISLSMTILLAPFFAFTTPPRSARLAGKKYGNGVRG
jgi:hypothetical protein